jgi:hypothetical protein
VPAPLRPRGQACKVAISEKMRSTCNNASLTPETCNLRENEINLQQCKPDPRDLTPETPYFRRFSREAPERVVSLEARARELADKKRQRRELHAKENEGKGEPAAN